MAGQSFSVINNLNSLNSQRNLGVSKFGLNNTLGKLSSGLRINNAGDDAAGLAIGSGLKADFMALSQAVRNANDGIGIVQVADGAFSQMSDMLSRATQLATQAASGTVGDAERDMINTEYQEILKEIDRVVDTTNYKGEQLFSQDGSVNKSIYVGDTQIESTIDVSIGGGAGAGTAAMGLSNTSLATAEGARDALSNIQGAIQNVSRMRGALGAQQNRLTNSIGVIQIQSQNILAAESSIMDANMAQEVSNLTKFRILAESGMASVAQSNASNQLVLQLFK
ncbi:MAG: flagellin FliC [bacterium]|nr:flagellin FliC [bacterium]